MNKFFRAIIAAWGAKKLGGGCLSTIVIFIIIYTLLGKCNNDSRAATTNIPVKAVMLKRPASPLCVAPAKNELPVRRVNYKPVRKFRSHIIDRKISRL